MGTSVQQPCRVRMPAAPKLLLLIAERLPIRIASSCLINRNPVLYP
jgi:hypothetical protein